MLETVSTTSFAWRFGGPLAGLPPALAWTLLAALALAGAALILLSYRRTLVALPSGPRRLLVSLRLLLWAGLLLALAGPARVERIHKTDTPRPLAVLVDRSGSMTAPDNRRQTRSDDALRRWRALAPAAAAAHGEIRAFAFADTDAPLPLASSALSGPALSLGAGERPAPGQTRLFENLDHLLAHAPAGGWGGIVALTDGLDTVALDSAAALEATTRAALASATPFYLVPGRNRHSGRPFLAFRELSLPAHAPPRSTVRLELAVDSYQAADRVVDLHLRVGERVLPPSSLLLESGRRLRTVSLDLEAAEPGLLPVELRLGEGPEAPTLRAEVRVAPPSATRILYFQGGLDWGYRFLADILRRDPSFSLDPVFHLGTEAAPRPAGAAQARRPGSPSGRPALAALPDTLAGYSGHDLVILANAQARQFTAAQQEALSAWVRQGGVLLFLAPDEAATHAYAGTELEKMLPVVFAAPAPAAAEDAALAEFREQMRRMGAQNSIERDFAQRAARETRVAPLHDFAWEPAARQLLGPEITEIAPRFAHYSRVHRAKPAAEVLARHPRDLAPRGDEGSAAEERAILLALQRYGRGWSAVLTSDALWRWKLAQPSEDRGVERFWQNLLAWLSREVARGPRFERAPLQAEPGRELVFRIAGAATRLGGVTIEIDPESRPPGQAAPTTQIPLFARGEDGGLRLHPWTPPSEGRWLLTARGAADEELIARHWITVSRLATGEDSGLPPDEALLRGLAERSGGAVLDTTPPVAWRAASARSPTFVRETLEPLWHRPWIFLALLGLYATELLLRRRFKLL